MNVKFSGFDFVDAAKIVTHTFDANDLTFNVHHLPPGKVVDGRPPKGGLLAARINGDVASNTARVSGRWINGKNEACCGRSFFNTARHAARTTFNHGVLTFNAREFTHHRATMTVELFHIDDGTHFVKRHGATRIACPTRARNNCELQFKKCTYQRRNFFFTIGEDHHERVFHTPVGRISDVGHTGKTVKTNIGGRCDGRKALLDFSALGDEFRELGLKLANRVTC